MSRPGPRYPAEFRAEAVRLLSAGDKSVAALSRELGVPEQTLRRWRLQADEDRGEAAAPTADERSATPEPEPESGLPHEEQEAPADEEGAVPVPPSSDLPTLHEREARQRRLTLSDRGGGRIVRRLAGATAGLIEVGVAVVTWPARWAATGLRRYADQDRDPGRTAE
jgi:transposase-like protein